MKLARHDPSVFYPATKEELAHSLGLSRASLYYQPKKPDLDLKLKTAIEQVLSSHPSYGHKRIAIELKINKKRVLRVMKLFDLKPYRRRAQTPAKPDDYNKPSAKFPNLIERFCPIAPNVVWVADFTYLKFHDRFIYLATIMDVYTREVLSWHTAYHHTKELVVEALIKALEKNQSPFFHHCDQGSEYEATTHMGLLTIHGIQVSMSRKSSPWENAFQESFYSQFKVDLGHVNRFETVGELIEAVAATMYYYNHTRIHTSLKMSPKQFNQTYQQKLIKHIHSRV